MTYDPVDSNADGVVEADVNNQLTDTEQQNNAHYVSASDDLQTKYDNAPADGKVVITEDHTLSSTFQINRGEGPRIEFQGSLVPDADVTAIEVTGVSTIEASLGTPIVDDKNSVTTTGSHGMVIHAKTVIDGVAHIKGVGGHGVYLHQSALSDNVNESLIRCFVQSAGGDGVRAENTTTNAVDLNEIECHLLLANNCGGVGLNILDGIGWKLDSYVQNSTGSSYEIAGSDHTGTINEESGAGTTITATDSFFQGRLTSGFPTDVPDSTVLWTQGNFEKRGAGMYTAFAVENNFADNNSRGIEIPFKNTNGARGWIRLRGNGIFELEAGISGAKIRYVPGTGEWEAVDDAGNITTLS